MNSQELVLHRPEQLRAAVASLGHAMEKLPGEATARTEAATARLLELWKALVALLDLPPPPELRVCPACAHTGMRAATRCGFCWIALAPLTERAAEAAGTPSGEVAIRRPIAGLIASFRLAAGVFLASWRAGLDRALRYVGRVRA